MQSANCDRRITNVAALLFNDLPLLSTSTKCQSTKPKESILATTQIKFEVQNKVILE